jgi:hypothetical protein
MKMPAKMAIALAIAALSGCSTALIEPKDRAQICHVAVVEKFQRSEYHANPLANPITGPLLGTTAGAAGGLLYGAAWGPLNIVTVPLGTIIGGVGGGAYGLACGLGSIANSNGSAEFQHILEGVNTDNLKRALQQDLDSRKLDCGRQTNNPAPTVPDTTIEIEKVTIGMGCGIGKQSISVAVDWHVIAQADSRLLGRKTTICEHRSVSNFDEWFVNKEAARIEIEYVLSRTGSRMSLELFSPRKLPYCGP